MSEWYQQTIQLEEKPRGAHLVTDELIAQLNGLNQFRIGNLHLFLQHTSASLTINENADPSVRTDMNAYVNRLAPENETYYTHTLEGPDDMPAHLKTALLGFDLNIPVSAGKLNLGVWQGIYLVEHREMGGPRRLVATLSGSY